MKRMLQPTLPLSLIGLLLWAPSAKAEVRLPSVLGSNMVLQRDVPLAVWGWADPGEEVFVTLAGNKAGTRANADGEWKVQLPPLAASAEPLEMTVVGRNTLRLANVLVGEVWIGSGQSNMQWSVSASSEAAEEIAAANFPRIRLFLAPLIPSGTPSRDIRARWDTCSPRTIPQFSAVLYFFGREIHRQLNVPVGLIATSWGGTRIEPWIPPEGFASNPSLAKEREALSGALAQNREARGGHLPAMRSWLAAAEKAAAEGRDVADPPAFPQHPLNGNSAPTGLYNGMIYGLVPYPIRGALWYQGEANRGQGMYYHELMKALISGWRQVWGLGDFPFLFVQLAPFNYAGSETALPEIWEAQAATLSVPNTGMAVTTDIATLNDIHPTNKQEVGRRLALWALARTYGRQVAYSGPLYDSMSAATDGIRIRFTHATGGLTTRDGKSPTWFTIAGEDKRFHPAEAAIEGETIVVRSQLVPKPVAVRFGWHQLAEPNLINQAGLPASPFRTDRWGDAANFPAPR